VDEMWVYVGKKTEQRWLWHAIDHRTGKVLAYVFGRCQDEVFLKLKALLEPFGITRYYTDYWGAYTCHFDADEHEPGKRNTQKIERKPLTLRTWIKRLARKAICFSKSIQMHDIGIGSFVNGSVTRLSLTSSSKLPSTDLKHDPVMDQDAIRMIGWNRFAELLHGPLSGGMRRDLDVDESTARLFNDHKYIENAKCCRDRHTEIVRHNVFSLVADKGGPALRGAAFVRTSHTVAGHILAHSSRRDS